MRRGAVQTHRVVPSAKPHRTAPSRKKKTQRASLEENVEPSRELVKQSTCEQVQPTLQYKQRWVALKLT